MKEEWRPIAGGRCAVSDQGRVRRVVPGRGARAGYVLANQTGKVGYLVVTLSREEGKQSVEYVHHLVAEAFIGPRPDGKEINHINGNKTDGRACNLEYVTPSENRRHAFRMGLWHPPALRGEAHGNAKLNERGVRAIRNRAREGESHRSLARRFGVSKSLVTMVVNRQIWSHVT